MDPKKRKIKMTGFPVKLSDTPARLYLSPPLLGDIQNIFCQN